MASDSDAKITPIQDYPIPHFAPTDTQILPFSSPEKLGEDVNELEMVKKMVTFDDTVPFDDCEFDTQVVDFGEFQTQVLDDPDCGEYMDTQLVDDFDEVVAFDSDGEGTNTTEILVDGDHISGDEMERRGNCESVDGERAGCVPCCKTDVKGLMERTNDVPVKQPGSGSIPRFTSVRTASLRASGRAARINALKRTHESNCPLTNSQVSEQRNIENKGSKTKFSEEVDLECDDKGKGLSNGTKGKVSRPTVRKLFTENLCNKDGLNLNSDSILRQKELHLPTVDDALAELSYVDSQEPGELSQANALACVERLIDENKMLFDDEVNPGNRSRGNPDHISTAKGPQSLAKKANDKGIAGIFDWDDGREDEGGGDFFCRRKEEFFGNGNLGHKSLTNPQKHKGKQLDGHENNEGKSDVQNKAMAHSDSKLVLKCVNINCRTLQETGMNFKKNLVNQFNEQSNADTSPSQFDEQLETSLAGKGRTEMLNVGLDTQIAAEAMEALFHGEGIAQNNANGSHPEISDNGMDSLKGSLRKKAKRSVRSKKCCLKKNCDVGVKTRHAGRTKSIGAKSSEQSFVTSYKSSETAGKERDSNAVTTRRKGEKSNADKLLTTYGSKIIHKVPAKTVVLGVKFDACDGTDLNRGCSIKKQGLLEELTAFTPIARRTRQSSQLKSAQNGSSGCANKANLPVNVRVGVEGSELLNAEGKSEPKPTGTNNGTFPTRRRSLRNKSHQLNEPDNLDAQCKPSCEPDDTGRSMSGRKRSRCNTRITSADLNMKKVRSSMMTHPDLSPIHRNSEEFSSQSSDKLDSDDADMNGKRLSGDVAGPEAMKPFDKKSNLASSSAGNKMHVSSDKSPKEIIKPSEPACTSPGSCMTPVNAASPVCMGDGYLKKSCRKSLSGSCLLRDYSSLVATSQGPLSATKDSRKRRDLANVRVLFSHHLDDDIIKQQRKIADRLKVSIVSSITDATHFVTDKFVRTRNMLEAIASGKPVVTHLWLENVGRAKYYIDEQKFILRDMKKEKEFGFNMSISLSHALQHPLLQGRRVLVTPSAKPSKEIVSSLVKTVQGQAVERVGRSALKDDIFPDDLLVLSCEEDYEVCVPFLEKGAAIYSSELLLNGIVIQKLEYERHQLFADHVKRTRSTIWLKKDGLNFIPVPKNK